MTAKVPMTDTGTATMGIRVVRRRPRKRNTTAATSTNAMNSVFTSSWMVDFTNTVVSKNTS